MGNVRWSPTALFWLREIRSYIARDNPDAARRTVRGIVERLEVLERFPEIGQLHETRSGRPYRVLLYGHYRIAYRVVEEGTVELIGIFHGALDIKRFLS